MGSFAVLCSEWLLAVVIWADMTAALASRRGGKWDDLRRDANYPENSWRGIYNEEDPIGP